MMFVNYDKEKIFQIFCKSIGFKSGGFAYVEDIYNPYKVYDKKRILVMKIKCGKFAKHLDDCSHDIR